MISKKKLWQEQMVQWPDSVRLTVEEVLKWCDEAKTVDGRLSRYMQMCMAMQYPSVVFYRIEGTNYRGFRYGLDGGAYMSMYSAT